LVVPVYTSCVPRGALRFFIKVLLTYQKKKVMERKVELLFDKYSLLCFGSSWLTRNSQPIHFMYSLSIGSHAHLTFALSLL